MQQIRWIMIVGLLLMGCAESELAVLYHAQLPTDTCKPMLTPDGPRHARGIMDISLLRTYTFVPMLENRSDSTLLLQNATVSFTSDNSSLDAVFAGSSLSFPIAGSIQPRALSAIQLEVISEALGRQIEGTTLFVQHGNSANIEATVQISAEQGNTGERLRSDSYVFELEVCAGCLLEYPPNTLHTDDDGSPTCDVSKNPNTNPDTLPTCIYGQDTPVDCRICRSQIGASVAADIVCDPKQ